MAASVSAPDEDLPDCCWAMSQITRGRVRTCAFCAGDRTNLVFDDRSNQSKANARSGRARARHTVAGAAKQAAKNAMFAKTGT